jgi:hypothetical protein
LEAGVLLSFCWCWVDLVKETTARGSDCLVPPASLPLLVALSDRQGPEEERCCVPEAHSQYVVILWNLTQSNARDHTNVIELIWLKQLCQFLGFMNCIQ